MHDKYVSIKIALKYILVYHKCLSVHLTIHFKHISKIIAIIMKLDITIKRGQKLHLHLHLCVIF